MPPPSRVALAAQLAPYRSAHPRVRWTQPATWHLTLLFLGSVAPDRLKDLRPLIDEVAAADSAYGARADRGDGRSGRSPGVAWLGLSAGASRLIHLADELARACLPELTTGPAPRRTQSAHLTLVRRADAAVVRDLRSQRLGSIGVEWTMDQIELVRSHLGPEGSRYETLHRSPL